MNMACLSHFLFSFVVCVSFLVFVNATDSGPLQDFCVADLQSPVLVNGFVCRNPKEVNATDFAFTGLRNPGNTNNQLGSTVTPAFVSQFPAINTLGISMARLDFAPGGQNPPHSHPRASEILVVIQGTLIAGFITSDPNNTLFSQTLEVGDTFVFPQGLTHFQQNVGKGPALAFVALSSQNPGRITIANAVFGANPPVPSSILARAFMIGVKLVKTLQAAFRPST